ncbi:DUF1634 domain-containing protein [Saccharopolyspora sp. K220]|uniref:DUF1634 domain-containing protein n=1 Tax=Saccharopolyspora soli TaxID=2926618 RepID=UPI001F5A916B|nr:DUF1634 domain-containing protein [Saccharopolyspora soli]MCI2420319.1 DUF1634 domain-containing protein [Saccharopolyspora soli]
MTGAQANTQRETTPLRRDNTRIRPDRAAVPPEPEQATRPAFAPPPRRDPPPPVRQPTSRQAPVPEARRITPIGWVLRGLVLFAISVLSGLIWLLLKPGGDDEAAPPPDPPRYEFTLIRREEAFQGCQNVSTDKIRNFFQQHECAHLTRALYNTKLPNGTRVLTSVITVLMPDAAGAQQLNDLTTRDGTGNIRDLVDDERDGTKDMPDLDDDAYASGRQDRLVVIGDSAYFDKSTPKKDPALLDVTNEALKLGWPQDQSPR